MAAESEVRQFREPVGQKHMNTQLNADRPERPTIILGWSLTHARGILENDVLFVDFTVSRSGWHRNRGVFRCSQVGHKLSTQYETSLPRRISECKCPGNSRFA